MRANRGEDRGSTGSGNGREREWLSEPKTPDFQDSKRVQADCLSGVTPSLKCLSHVYILATTHVLSSILRPTLMTEILLTDASIGP
jgi:hypothetical protein